MSSTLAFKGQETLLFLFFVKIPCQKGGNRLLFLVMQSSVGCAAAQAVCTLKQEKADWDTAKRVLGEPGFMKSLLEFDKDHIPEAVMKKLRKYIDNPEFTAEAVAKQSKAAQSLCMWCRAMEVYDRIAKVILSRLIHALCSSVLALWLQSAASPCEHPERNHGLVTVRASVTWGPSCHSRGLWQLLGNNKGLCSDKQTSWRAATPAQNHTLSGPNCVQAMALMCRW